MIKHIDHINIVVSDLETSVSFFTEHLDFQVYKRDDLQGDWISKVVGLEHVKATYVQLILPGSETTLELIQYLSPVGFLDPKLDRANQLGYRHMALCVDNIQSHYDRLNQAGVTLFSEIQTYQDKKRLFYFLGPDNIVIELCDYLDHPDVT